MMYCYLNQKTLSLKGKLYSPKGQRSVTVHLNGIEAVGVWTMADDSPFICFEPWDGYPDLASETTLNLKEKEKIFSESLKIHRINHVRHLYLNKKKRH